MSDIIIDFQLKMPHLVLSMQNSTHHYEKQRKFLSLNDYHLEGDVWAHTMMVCLVSEINQFSDAVKYACLLHDIGKPLSRKENDEKLRVSFIGHEGISAYMSLDYLNKTSLSNEDKAYIFKLISLHTSILHAFKHQNNWEWVLAEKFYNDVSLFKDLIALSFCDASGRFMTNEFSYKNYQDFFNEFELVFEMMEEIKQKEKKNTSKELFILIGPPNSGKSTFIKKNCKDSDLVISRDQIILEQNKGLSYNQAYAKMDSGLVDSILHKQIVDASKNGISKVFIDMTNMSPSSRRRNFSQFSKDYKIIMVVFLTSYNTLLERNEIRSKNEDKSIPMKVMIDMMSKFNYPLMNEADEIQLIF